MRRASLGMLIMETADQEFKIGAYLLEFRVAKDRTKDVRADRALKTKKQMPVTGWQPVILSPFCP